MGISVDDLNHAIRDQSPTALELIGQLADVRIHDAHRLTPLNAAIRYCNRPAFEALFEHEAALTYTPELPKDDRQLLRHMSAEMGTGIRETEIHIANTLGQSPEQRHWMRTPLLEACRYANRDAMAALIGGGVKLNDKDALGAMAWEICQDVGGAELLHAFIDACIAHGRCFPVNTDFLQRTMHDPAVAEKAARHGKLDAKANRFRFNLACALLDTDTVEAMLNAGHDVKKSLVDERTPIDEAATSQLLWTHKHPDAERLAGPLLRVYDRKATTRVKAADIAAAVDAAKPWLNPDELPEPTEARREWSTLARIESARPDDLDPKPVAPDIVQRRLALIDRLIAAGADTHRVGHDLLSNVVLSNTPALLHKLNAIGVAFEPHDADGAMDLALSVGCFRMIEPLASMGLTMEPLQIHRARAYLQYRQWCAEQGLTPLTPPSTGGEPDDDRTSVTRFRDQYKAIAESPLIWALGGESTLQAASLPERPQAGEMTTIRLTHSNSYWPMDEVQFAIRVGQPSAPTPIDQADSVDDWQAMVLIEELLDVEGEIIPRDEAEDDDMVGEVPWDGTFEAQLCLPAGRCLIEIRVSAPDGGSVSSGIIADWTIETGVSTDRQPCSTTES